jgi:hypothetical protein
MSYWAGVIGFVVPYYCYTQAISGKMIDGVVVGLCIYTCIVFYTHIMFFTFIRDFNYVMVVVGGCIWLTMPLIYLAAQGLNLEPTLYKAIYTEIFADGMFWLVTIVTTALMVFPIVAYRFVRDLILFPKFNFA